MSALARELGLPLPVASQYLRALQARGLLEVRRKGRNVIYRMAADPTNPHALGLVAALRQSFRTDAQAVETIFKTVTAFTHPRRVEIYRALKQAEQDLAHLQARTRFSSRALYRHLNKLASRGFVEHRDGVWVAAKRSGPVSRQLGRAL